MARIKYIPKCGAESLFPPLSEEELRRFEESIGNELPDDYRAFLLQWNGVRFTSNYPPVYPLQPVDDHSPHVPSWDIWTVNNRRSIYDDVETVSRLYGLRNNDRDSLWVTSTTEELNVWLPPRFLVIGNVDDQMERGQLLVSLGDPDYNQLFQWVFPVDPPIPGDNCPNMDYMSWIAPSFEEFWSCLREISEEDYFEWR